MSDATSSVDSRKSALFQLHSRLQKLLARESNNCSEHFKDVLWIFAERLARAKARKSKTKSISVASDNIISAHMTAHGFEEMIKMLDIDAPSSLVSSLFQKYDRDRDGRLTVQEFVNGPMPEDYTTEAFRISIQQVPL
jgi:hypothetical protein